ncbi:MAG: ABC transporter permease [Candidatus Jordarchaeum sp.]|uniref:ABC transporter permease n=1 Tax=Candidatus Jordarchaeum sp. TaxID=2823881 RepID=UPI004049285E
MVSWSKLSIYTVAIFVSGITFFIIFFLSPLGALVYSTINPFYADPAFFQRVYNIYLSLGPVEAFKEFMSMVGNPIINSLQSDIIVSAIQVSLITTAFSSVVCIAFGMPLAYILSRYNFWGKNVLDTAVDLPMVLPPTVAGISLILFLGPNTPLGSFLNNNGIEIIFTWRAIILAQIFVSAPFFIRSASTAFSGVPKNLELAAKNLGASPIRTFYTITLPLSGRGVFAGWAMMWARAMGEFGATIMVSNNVPGQSYTLTTAIYWQFWAGGLFQSISAAVVLLIIAFVVLVSVRILMGRG